MCPRLIVVTNNANGDNDPAEWMPPEGSFACTFVRACITVNHFYGLSVYEAEFEALREILDSFQKSHESVMYNL